MNKYYVYGAGTVGICDSCLDTIDKRTISHTTFGTAEQCVYCLFGSNTRDIYRAICNIQHRYGRGDITHIVWDKRGYYGVSGIVICKLQYGMAPYRITVTWDEKIVVDYRGHKRTVKKVI